MSIPKAVVHQSVDAIKETADLLARRGLPTADLAHMCFHICGIIFLVMYNVCVGGGKQQAGRPRPIRTEIHNPNCSLTESQVIKSTCVHLILHFILPRSHDHSVQRRGQSQLFLPQGFPAVLFLLPSLPVVHHPVGHFDQQQLWNKSHLPKERHAVSTTQVGCCMRAACVDANKNAYWSQSF